MYPSLQDLRDAEIINRLERKRDFLKGIRNIKSFLMQPRPTARARASSYYHLSPFGDEQRLRYPSCDIQTPIEFHPGLQVLQDVDFVTMKQLVPDTFSIYKIQHYAIQNRDGVTIVMQMVIPYCSKKDCPRGCSHLQCKVETIRGDKIGTVFWKGKYENKVFDGRDRHVFSVREDAVMSSSALVDGLFCSKILFKTDNQRVGIIEKLDDPQCISFSPDLSVPLKATLLGSAFLINFQAYEKRYFKATRPR